VPHALLHVLIALTVIVLTARAIGVLFARIGQPAVIGEVIAGIALGPSLLGRVSPRAMNALFPAPIVPSLAMIAQVGVILFMFLVGTELDTASLRKRTHVSVAISHASIVVPFALGWGLSVFLHDRFAPAGVSHASFSLFMGVAMSITAFPVLARILTDRRLQHTRLGAIALSCAAVDDVTAWCLLAFVVGFVKSDSASALRTLVLSVVYVAFMLLVVRRAVHSFAARVEREGELSRGAVSAVFVALLLSALATEAIGIHALFGAFLLGAFVPHDSVLAREIGVRMHDLVVVLLLPAFFAFTGLRTQIGLLHGVSDWLICGVIIVAASAGKFGGSYVAARLTGLDRADAAAIGVLMNTRGLMELVALNVGLDLGVLSPPLFAMMVVMALVTTIATAPVLQWIGTRPDDEPVAAERTSTPR
jgi:Kef-type K+ transport system membrane component KefB